MNTLSRKQAGRRLNQWTVRYHRRGRSNNVALPSASQETCGRLDVEGMDLQRNWLQLWWLTLNLIWVSPCVYVGGHTSPHCGRSASERSGADCYSRGSGEWLWCWLGCKSEGPYLSCFTLLGHQSNNSRNRGQAWLREWKLSLVVGLRG